MTQPGYTHALLIARGAAGIGVSVAPLSADGRRPGRALTRLSGAPAAVAYPHLAAALGGEGAAALPAEGGRRVAPVSRWDAARLMLVMDAARFAGGDGERGGRLAGIAASLDPCEAGWWRSLYQNRGRPARVMRALELAHAADWLDASPRIGIWEAAQTGAYGIALRERGAALVVYGGRGRALLRIDGRRMRLALPHIEAALARSTLGAAGRLRSARARLTENAARQTLLVMTAALHQPERRKASRLASAAAAMHECEAAWWHARYHNRERPRRTMDAMAALYG